MKSKRKSANENAERATECCAVTDNQKHAVPLKDRLALSPEEASALSGIGLTSIRAAAKGRWRAPMLQANDARGHITLCFFAKLLDFRRCYLLAVGRALLDLFADFGWSGWCG